MNVDDIIDIARNYLGAECFDKVVLEHVLDEICIKKIISKLLGIGILGGSTLLKLPQIVAILLSGDVAGISPISFYCELPMVTALIAYNYLKGNPFISYGENVFIAIQNLILVCLLWTYMKPAPTLARVLNMTLGFIVFLMISFNMPAEYQFVLPMTTVPLLLLSRLSQVMTNHKNKSTGSLSVITTLLSFAGAFARIFTTVQEVGWDWGLLSGFMTTAALTGILVIQFILYAGNKVKSATTTTSQDKKKKSESKKNK